LCNWVNHNHNFPAKINSEPIAADCLCFLNGNKENYSLKTTVLLLYLHNSSALMLLVGQQKGHLACKK